MIHSLPQLGESTVDLLSPGPIGSATPSTGAFTTLSAGDAQLTSPGAGICRFASLASAAQDCTLQIMALNTDASNYHYGSLAMADAGLTISTQTAGTGVDNLDIVLTPSGTGAVKVSGSSALQIGDSSHYMIVAGNFFDLNNIAASGLFRLFGTAGVQIRTATADPAVTIAAAGDLTGVASIKSSGATSGIGYATGAGGTVTQATSKATGVTLNKATGDITLNGAALASAAIVSFVLTNSAIAATDTLILNHVATGTFGGYLLNARCAAGSATIDVRNVTAGSLSEAIVIKFALLKAVTS